MVGSMSRLIIFIVVVLPQPDGPTSTHELAGGDVEVELVHARRCRRGRLADPLQPDHRRCRGSVHRVAPSSSIRPGASCRPTRAAGVSRS